MKQTSRLPTELRGYFSLQFPQTGTVGDSTLKLLERTSGPAIFRIYLITRWQNKTYKRSNMTCSEAKVQTAELSQSGF